MLMTQNSYYPRIKLLTRQDGYYPRLNCIFRVGEHLFGSKRKALIQTSVLGLLTGSTRIWSSAEADLKSFGEIVTIWGVLVRAHSLSDHNAFTCPVTLTTMNSCYKKWWQMMMNWDMVMDDDMKKRYERWQRKLAKLLK
jgi:hypothetical protein